MSLPLLLSRFSPLPRYAAGFLMLLLRFSLHTACYVAHGCRRRFLVFAFSFDTPLLPRLRYFRFSATRLTFACHWSAAADAAIADACRCLRRPLITFPLFHAATGMIENGRIGTEKRQQNNRIRCSSPIFITDYFFFANISMFAAAVRILLITPFSSILMFSYARYYAFTPPLSSCLLLHY